MAGFKRVSAMKAKITPTFSRNKFKDGKNHSVQYIGGKGRKVSGSKKPSGRSTDS